jgi:hypothetical protein
MTTADESIPSHASTNFNAPVKLVVIIQLSTPISYSLSLETLTHFHMATHRNANRYPQISIHPILERTVFKIIGYYNALLLKT